MNGSEITGYYPARAQYRGEDGFDYQSVSQKLVMPGDLNPAARLFGGRLMEWIDEYAALYCMAFLGTHSIATKKISEVVFNKAANLGDILDFLYRVKSCGTTSLTIGCLVVTKPLSSADEIKKIVDCEVVFVSLDETGRPTPHHRRTPV
jgi:acyl-CoA thioesterase YciA